MIFISMKILGFILICAFIRMADIVSFRLSLDKGQKVIAITKGQKPYIGVITVRGSCKVEMDNGVVYDTGELYPRYYLIRRFFG